MHNRAPARGGAARFRHRCGMIAAVPRGSTPSTPVPADASFVACSASVPGSSGSVSGWGAESSSVQPLVPSSVRRAAVVVITVLLLLLPLLPRPASAAGAAGAAGAGGAGEAAGVGSAPDHRPERVSLSLAVPASSSTAAALFSGSPDGPSTSRAGWQWPLAAPVAIVNDFVAPATRYSSGHRGIDLAAAAGVEVRAPASGRVVFTGVVVDRPIVSIEHAGGLRSSVEPVASTVAAGTEVSAGQEVGRMASGGHCGRSCVHFGVRRGDEYVNPRGLIEEIPRAVLLPRVGDIAASTIGGPSLSRGWSRSVPIDAGRPPLRVLRASRTSPLRPVAAHWQEPRPPSAGRSVSRGPPAEGQPPRTLACRSERHPRPVAP